MVIEHQFPSLRGVAAPSSVALGQRGLVHIWGRNDMATQQQLGMHWVVRDPEGVVVEDFSDWEWGYTGPGDAQEFIGGRFDINKPGTWTIKADLVMNPAAIVIVDTYDGVLCVVAEVEEYAGTIIEKVLEYDETRAPIPVS